MTTTDDDMMIMSKITNSNAICTTLMMFTDGNDTDDDNNEVDDDVELRRKIPFFFCFFSVDRAEGGECCRGHYDRFGLRHETTWCSHYCCQDRSRPRGTLYCCSDFFLRAERSDRLDFCSSWFTASANL